MRKLEKTNVSRNYQRVRGSLDDLSAIWKLITDACDEPKLQTSEYAFDDVREIGAHFPEGHVLPAISITGKNPNVSLNFDRYGALLLVFDTDPVAKTLFREIDDILSPMEKNPNLFFNGWYLFGYFIFVQLFFKFADGVVSEAAFPILTSILILLLILWAIYWSVNNLSFSSSSSKIRAVFKSGRSNFFRRNRDTLIVGAIAASVGSLITIGATIILVSLGIIE